MDQPTTGIAASVADDLDALAATNGHKPPAAPRRPTLSQLAAKTAEASDGLYDQMWAVEEVMGELERAIEQLEAAKVELGRRVRSKRDRDARYRARRRQTVAA